MACAPSRIPRGAPVRASTTTGTSTRVGYVPAESTTGLFGGNSNWRGPVWMPVNYLLIESLYEFHRYYGDDFRVEYPTGSGTYLDLRDIADRLAHRLAGLFLRDAAGCRPVLGENSTLQTDPAFKDHIPFHEYFHGDTGEGLGASHQTGWTGLVALLLQPRFETEVYRCPAAPGRPDARVPPKATSG